MKESTVFEIEIRLQDSLYLVLNRFL